MSPQRDKSSPVLFEKARSRRQQVNRCLHKESLFGRNEREKSKSRRWWWPGSSTCKKMRKTSTFGRWFGYEGADVLEESEKVREGGGVVSARIAIAAARGIVLTCYRSLLVEFGGQVEFGWHVELSKHWACSLLHRMKFVQRKITTAKSKPLLTLPNWRRNGD